MKANKNTLEIGIPDNFKYEDVLFRNYSKWTKLHYSHGFRDYIKPTITELQKLSEIFYDEEKDVVTHNVIDFTQQEIDEYNDQLQQQSLDHFMLQKEVDGKAYYKEIDKRITASLLAIDRNVLFSILEEIENCLYPPLSKIKTGDFASALCIFENQNLPINALILNFYNEAKIYCENYYNTKYPK